MIKKLIVLAALLATPLMACNEGNSASGKLMLSGNATGDLTRSIHVELLKWRKPVSLRLAPGSTFDVYVDEPNARTPVTVSSASVGDTSATAQIVAPGVVRVTAIKPGETNLRIQGIVDGKTADDTMPLVIKSPNSLEISEACSDSDVFWAGHPAVVRYEFREEPMPGGSGLDGRIFGLGYAPVKTNPALAPLHSNGFEWVFSGLETPGEAVLTGTVDGKISKLSLKFETPPKVNGIGLLGISTSGVLRSEFQGPIGTKNQFRVFPVGEEDRQMCNTVAAAQVEATTKGCVVRTLDNDAEFATTAKSRWGMFEVAANQGVDKCTFQVTLDRAGWQFESEEPIRRELITSFFPIK